MKVEQIIATTEGQELVFNGATLLSIEEYEKYKIQIPAVNYWWWLRSPGNFQDYAAGVCLDGSASHIGRRVYYSNYGVRPVLKIKNFQSSNLKIGDEFIIKDVKFTVISENYAITNDIICNRGFDKKTNIYEKSEIKQFVDDWFKKNI